MSDTTCQADVMDRAVHGGPSPVPPCDGPRDMQRHGYWLCVGCAEAYDAILAWAGAVGEHLRARIAALPSDAMKRALQGKRPETLRELLEIYDGANEKAKREIESFFDGGGVEVYRRLKASQPFN